MLVKLVPLVEDVPKVPFSIASTPRCRRGHHHFPWIAPIYPYNAECLARRNQEPFFNFWYDSTWDSTPVL